MHYISRNFVKSSCEYHLLILPVTSGRGLKKDFGERSKRHGGMNIHTNFLEALPHLQRLFSGLGFWSGVELLLQWKNGT